MLRLLFILALVIAILVVVFALQNAIPITINVLIWQFQGSLALVLLLTLALGAIIGLLVSVPSLLKRSQEITRQKKRIAELQLVEQLRYSNRPGQGNQNNNPQP